MKRMAKQCLLGLWVCTLLMGVVQAQEDGGTARVSDLPGPLPPVAEQVPVPAPGQDPGWFQVTPVDNIFNPRVYFDARGGVLYGYQEGYTNVGAFLPYFIDDDAVVFVDGRGMVSYDGRGGANVGVGWRYYMSDIDRVIGLSAWYDFDAGHIRSYNQIGLSFESLGRYFDMRINGYVPVGQDQNLISSGLTGENRFVGHRLLLTRANELETAFTGFDTEIGGPMPLLGRYGLGGYVGFYFYTSSSSDADFTGVSGRLTWQVNEDATIGVQMTDDHAFGTNAQIQIAMTLPDGKPGRWLRPLPVRHRLTQNVIRNYRVTVEREIKFEQEAALNPRDGLPYFIVHVDPNGPTGVAQGDGTIENPYNLLAQFDTLPFDVKSEVDIISVRPRTDNSSINLNDGVTLLTGQRLLSTSLAHTFQVVQQPNQVFVLPATDQSLAALPVLTNSSGGNVVTFANGAMHVEVSGFTINGSATGSGIVGTNNQMVNINRNVIANGLNGIRLQNLSGLAANNMQSVIDRNIIRGNSNDGIFIGNAGAAPLDLLITNNPALDVDLDGLLVDTDSDGVPDSTQPDSLDGDGDFSNDGIVNNGTLTGTTSNGGDGIDINADAGSVITVYLDANQVRANADNGLEMDANANSTIQGLIINNVFANNFNDGVRITASNSTLDFLNTSGFVGGSVTANQFLANGGDGLEINAVQSLVSFNVTGNLFGDPTVTGSQNGNVGLRYVAQGGNGLMIIGGPNAVDGNTFFAHPSAGIFFDLSGNNVTSTNIENNIIAYEILLPGGTILRSGFDQFVLAGNDNGSTGLVPVGFLLNYFGTSFTDLFVNNNGNVSFGLPLATFPPATIAGTPLPMIAPFFADVDTRLGNEVTYGTGTVNGRPAFGVNWIDVRHNSVLGTNQGLPTNTFQMVLVDRSDIAPGDFDIEFNYEQILWEAGEASGANPFGLGGAAARVGYTNGAAADFELPGSGINGAFLDSGPAATSLINNSLNSPLDGRYVFFARGGTVTNQPSAVVGTQDGIRINVGGAAQLTNSTIQNNTITGNSGFGINVQANALGQISNLTIQNNQVSNNGGGIRIRRDGSSTIDVTLLNNEVNQNNTNGLQIEAYGSVVGDVTVTMDGNTFDRNVQSGMSISAGGSARVTVDSQNDTFTNSGGNNISVFTTDQAIVNLTLDQFVATNAGADGFNADVRGNSTFVITLFNDPTLGTQGFDNNAGDGFSVSTDEAGLALVDLDGLSFSNNGGDGLVFDRDAASLLLARVLNATVTGNGDDGIQFYVSGSATNDPNTPLFDTSTSLAPASRLVLADSTVDANGTLGAAAPNRGNGLETATFSDAFLVVNATATSFSRNQGDGVRSFAGMHSSYGDRVTGERSTFDGVTLNENALDGMRVFVQGLNSSVPDALVEINSNSRQTLIQNNGDDGIQGSVIYGNLDILVQSNTVNPAAPRTWIQRNGRLTGVNGHGIEFNVGDAANDNDDTNGANTIAQFFFPPDSLGVAWQITQPASQPILAVGDLTVLDVVTGDENMTDTIGNGNAGNGVLVYGGILFSSTNFAITPNYTDRFQLGAVGPVTIVNASTVVLPNSQANVVIDNVDASNNGDHGLNFFGVGDQAYIMPVGTTIGGAANDFLMTELTAGAAGGVSFDTDIFLDSIGPAPQLNVTVANSRIEQNLNNGINIDLTGRFGQNINFLTNQRDFANTFIIDNNLIQGNGLHGVFFQSNAGAQDFARVDFQDPQPTTPPFPYDPDNVGLDSPFIFNGGFNQPGVVLDSYLDISTDANTNMVFTNNTVRFNGGRIPGVGEGVFVRVSTDSYLSLDFGGAFGSGNGNTFTGNHLADVRFESFIQYQTRPDLAVGGIPARIFETPPQSQPNGAPTEDVIFLDHTAQMDLRFNNNSGSELSAPFTFFPQQAAIYPLSDGASPSGKGPGPRAVQMFQLDNGVPDINGQSVDTTNFWAGQILSNEFSAGNFYLRFGPPPNGGPDPAFPNPDFPENYFNDPGNPFLP